MFHKLIFIFTLLLATNTAFAQWTLDNTKSSIHFISIKKSKVAESHHFKKMQGSINNKGDITLDIDLSSVETKIPIRNDRMKTVFFETSQFSTAQITASINPNKLAKMKVGDAFTVLLKVKLSLHDLKKSIAANVNVVKLSDNRLFATTVTPIIVNAADYALAEGIEKLRTIAGLTSISLAVPVTLNLYFNP